MPEGHAKPKQVDKPGTAPWMFMHRLCPYKSSLADPTASLHGLEKGEATAKTLQAGKHR